MEIDSKEQLIKILDTLTDRLDQNVLDWEICLGYIDVMLEEMLCDDVFGTEGQLDPRGDNRK